MVCRITLCNQKKFSIVEKVQECDATAAERCTAAGNKIYAIFAAI